MGTTNKKKVLIAEDEPQVRQMICKIVGKDYIALEAENGREAVVMTRKHNPALVLMDIMMPTMDGYTSCHMIKTDPATEATRVLMLTGVAYETNMELARQIGADGYMVKPFSAQDLLARIKRLVEKV